MKKLFWLLSAVLIAGLAGFFLWRRLLLQYPVAPVLPTTPATKSAVGKNVTEETIPQFDLTAVKDVAENEAIKPIAPSVKGAPSPKPQFVVLAFDGSKSLAMWRKTREFAQNMIKSGKPVHFTYFVSGVYFIAPEKKSAYQAPQHEAGKSGIGWSAGDPDVAARLEQVNLALAEGHEIGSHAVGHYSGAAWTAADWQSELSQFAAIIDHPENFADLSRQTDLRNHLNLKPAGVIGFRAPVLGVDAALYPALAAAGYQYDTSKASNHPERWPKKNAQGLWEFPLARIPVAHTEKNKILAMDYNFYFRQTGAASTVKQGSAEWQKYYQETKDSYDAYFQTNYQGDHAPVFIGHHFSEWNDDLYWAVMQDFAQEVCGLPAVRCVTYRDLVSYLNAPDIKANK